MLNSALALKGQKAGASVKLHVPSSWHLWMYKLNNGGGEKKKGIYQEMYSNAKIKQIFPTLFFLCPLLDSFILCTLYSCKTRD